VKVYLQNKRSYAPTSTSRRKFIQAALAVPVMLALPAQALAGTGIHQLQGAVFINNRQADAGSRIRAGSRIVVAHDGELVFSIGHDAFLLKGGTAVELVGGSALSGLRLLTGSVLASLGTRSKPFHLVSSMAIVAVRGGAVYLSAEPHRLYTWTRYGESELRFGRQRQQISTSHDTAYEIVRDPAGEHSADMAGMSLNSTAVMEQMDDELRMLESLVDRVPAFDRQP
jgi:hypothetical protein